MSRVQQRFMAQTLKALTRTFLPQAIGLVSAALIWTYYDNHRATAVKPLRWVCRGCDSHMVFSPTSEAEVYLMAGNKIVLDCDCGQRYLVTKAKVFEFDEWNLVHFFRELLKRDIIEQIEWEQRHDTR